MLNYLKNAANVAYTANGAKVNATTGSALLDFFAQGGAMRSMSDSNKIASFTKAFAEDATLALRALFYFRDVREGQGERNTFRVLTRYLADYHTDSMKQNLIWVPVFGRWDDMYAFVGTRLETEAFNVITRQFYQDIDSQNPSLLGKWLKSENASSYETKQLAKLTRKYLGLSPRQYRKSLSSLRARIQIVESKMSANEWTHIEYSKLPSQAGNKYRQAFFNHDLDGYTSFLNSLKKGEVKVNTKTLYPYEVIRDLFTGQMETTGSVYNPGTRRLPANQEDAINTLWNNLPDYFGKDADNSIVVADTSGSMRGLPIQIAVSLGIYAAERNRGQFHNHFITFSGRPQLVELQGTGVCEKVRNMAKADWGSNTNIEAVFDLILNTAIVNKVSQDEMIDRIIIISDMQFDSARGGERNQSKLFDEIRQRYENAGYQMPSLVFWNVNAYTGNQPAKMTDEGVQLVSGASANNFTNILKLKTLSAYELMMSTLTKERYSVINA
jgi:hypothetical protein